MIDYNKIEMKRSKLLDGIKNKRKSHKKQYDIHVLNSRLFNVNDFVMIINTNTKTGETRSRFRMNFSYYRNSEQY